MKVRNLLLAGLAAFAMASCSNNDEVADGGEALVNNAKMRLTIDLPQAGKTRATEVGLPAESQINDLTVVVVNGTNVIVKSYLESELDKTEATKIMTTDFEVPAGTANVHAYVNYGKGTITAANYAGYKETATYEALTINNDIASITTKNFHMYGVTGTPVTINAGQVNHAVVKIDRVVAKIVEQTHARVNFNPGIITPDGTQYPMIELKDYSIVNMGTEVSTVKDNATDLTDLLYNPYKALPNENCENIFGGFVASLPLTKEQTSYCLANQTASEGTQTYIVYKAKITYPNNTGGNVIDGTFYVRDGKAYNLAALKAAYPNIYNDMDDSKTIKEWYDRGVLKYEDGYAYYKKPIKTTTNGVAKNEVLRNNVYKVTVTNITGIGAPALDIPPVGELTYLDVEIIVNEWTIQNNELELN